MVAVASRQQQQSRSGKAPSLSFWRLANGSDPYGGVYTGSYAGARSASGGRSSSHDTTKSKDGGGGEGGGIAKHWASDTTVENPHGLGTHVTALEYDPRRNVAVSAGEDGAFKLWGMKRNASTVETLAATAAAAAAVVRGGRGGKREEVSETHWACTLSVRWGIVVVVLVVEVVVVVLFNILFHSGAP